MSLFAVFAIFASALSPQEDVQGKDFEYKVGSATMQGYVALPAKVGKPVPAVIVVHDWNGIDEYEKMRARMIAKLGYVGFCADIYGAGVRPRNNQESSAEAGKYYADNALLLQRIRGALNAIRSHPNVDKSRVAAMGYCFGGMTVLELARSGSDVKGVVSFHGSLGTKNRMKKGAFKGQVAIFHGAADRVVPQADVDAIKLELNEAGVDFDFVTYAGADHGFTVKREGTPSASYQEFADKDSWSRTERFLAAIF